MLNVMSTAMSLGYLKVDSNRIIDIKEMHKHDPSKIVIITTGSQGEPLSALTRIAYGEHKKIQISSDDVVILSANPIPGNEIAVTRVINKLMEHGTEVIYKSLSEIHVSGHACQEELKLILNLTKPKYLIPAHGEVIHMNAHANLAMQLGMPEENILMLENGDCVEFDSEGMTYGEPVPAGNIMVDGLGVGDVGNIVLRDRKWLSEDGLIVVVLTVSKQEKKVISGPDIVSRGFVYVRESGDLMDEARSVVSAIIENAENTGRLDWNTLKNNIKDGLKEYIYAEIKRKPMILPIIMEV